MLLLLAGFLFLTLNGYSGSSFGFVALVFCSAGSGVGLFLLLATIGANPTALKGTAGLILGNVARFDERDQVFSRNRSLRPGSEQYAAYYREHPEKEAFDTQRRSKGGPLGKTGLIDNPRGDANVAMMLASILIPEFLSSLDAFKPRPHKALQEKLKAGKTVLSNEQATLKVKAYARKVGADLVGITRINPHWMYSRRGEIFNDNWEEWGVCYHK